VVTRNSPGQPAHFDIALARRYLRQRQAYWARLVGAAELGDTLAQARERAAFRQASAVRDGPWYRTGPFTYQADTEAARWSATSEIIERVSPGPYEDATFFELLARQAASLELGLSQSGDKPGLPPGTFARVILGTTGEARSEASTALAAGVAVISVSAGLMEFMYQCAKAVVLAWKKVQPDPGAALALSGRAEDTEEVLDSDPYPATLLRDTLTSWLYQGRPRAPHATKPVAERSWPLGLIINGAERFVLGHEYGHALVDQLAVPELTAGQAAVGDQPWAQEFAMDAFGAMGVMYSTYLDRLPPNMALQGAVTAMKVHEIFDAVLGAIAVRHAAPAATTHPPFEQRLDVIKQVYRLSHPDPETVGGDMAGMLVPAQTLDLIWARIKEPVLRVVDSGLPLHPVWATSEETQ
jgi:hypothetical protein